MCEIIPFEINQQPVASHALEILNGNAGLCSTDYPYIVGFTGDDITTLLTCLWCYQALDHPWFASWSEIALDAIAFNFQNIDDANMFLDTYGHLVHMPVMWRPPV